MPARQNSDTLHRHAEAKPARTRKSKPKFELPEAAPAAAQDVGWVYRADEELPAVDVQATFEQVAEEVRHVPAAELAVDAVLVEGHPAAELPPLPPISHEDANAMRYALMAGMGMIALGVLTTGLVSIAAYSILTAPLRMARNFMAPR